MCTEFDRLRTAKFLTNQIRILFLNKGNGVWFWQNVAEKQGNLNSASKLENHFLN